MRRARFLCKSSASCINLKLCKPKLFQCICVQNTLTSVCSPYPTDCTCRSPCTASKLLSGSSTDTANHGGDTGVLHWMSSLISGSGARPWMFTLTFGPSPDPTGWLSDCLGTLHWVLSYWVAVTDLAWWSWWSCICLSLAAFSILRPYHETYFAVGFLFLLAHVWRSILSATIIAS